MDRLHIDIETFSSIDLKKAGLYRYAESIDFEILLITFSLNDEPVEIVDFFNYEIPAKLYQYLNNPAIKKHAHNASFERICLQKIGYDIPASQWECSMIKAAYCGLPLSLDHVSKALELGDNAKSVTGKNLIKYFSMPCKPTKVNGGRFRNLPKHDPDKWEQFKDYCKQDLIAERAIHRRLERYELPEQEKKYYIIDQQINDRGVLIDKDFAKSAIAWDVEESSHNLSELKGITGLDNPNSLPQLKSWLQQETGEAISSLTKDTIPELQLQYPAVAYALELKLKTSKTSVKKYESMINCVCSDNRVHGLLQFYGANRTGRWAGRLVQLHNLPQNHLASLSSARKAVISGGLDLMYDSISPVLSQLIRTAFIAPEGKILAVADFSAIEARVVAWLAGEQWRLDVFDTHGKIYEASASKMFHVPIEDIPKDSEYRQKGKIAELALGYQGSVGALKVMGGEAMGLGENEMRSIVNNWRKANPFIVELWTCLEDSAIQAMQYPGSLIESGKIGFFYNNDALIVKLPSDRTLMYWGATLHEGKFGLSIRYKGIDNKIWGWVDTYGGKLAENVTQAIARDLLANALENVSRYYPVILHVHDELVAEIEHNSLSADKLHNIKDLMCLAPEWAKGLPLNADGFLTKFYKK